MSKTYFSRTDSPMGSLLLLSDGKALTGLHMRDTTIKDGWIEDAGPFAEALDQLAAYFAGKLTTFTLPLSLAGTPFQLRAWDALRAIPYGQRITYGEQARNLGIPGAARAVGAANGRNPISILVPCHRVVGADGSLTGYAGGMERKAILLALERSAGAA